MRGPNCRAHRRARRTVSGFDAAPPTRIHQILAWPTDPELSSMGGSAKLRVVSVLSCKSAYEVEGHLDRIDVGCVVLDPIVASDWLRTSRAQELLASTPIVLRTALSPRTARLISELSSIVAIGRVSLVGTASVDRDIALMLDNPAPRCADGALLGPRINGLPSPLRHAVIGAVSIGDRRMTVTELAGACRLPSRTLQWRLARTGGHTASDLLAWSLALHCLWRFDVLGWPLKRCTTAANFDDAGSMAMFIQRHVGQRPNAIVADGGFDALRERWLTNLGVGGGPADREQTG